MGSSSLTSLRENLIKIGAKVVSRGRYVMLQLAEVAVPRQMFQGPVADRSIAGVAPALGALGPITRQTTTAEVRLDYGKATSSSAARPAIR